VSVFGLDMERESNEGKLEGKEKRSVLDIVKEHRERKKRKIDR
jgi:hypothetical protein